MVKGMAQTARQERNKLRRQLANAQELRELLQKMPTSKEMADFLEQATPEQRKEFMQELARLIIDLHRPALKELERY